MKETKIPRYKKKPSKGKAPAKNKIIIQNWWMRGTSESVHEWDQRPPIEDQDRRPERQSRRWKASAI